MPIPTSQATPACFYPAIIVNIPLEHQNHAARERLLQLVFNARMPPDVQNVQNLLAHHTGFQNMLRLL